MVGNPFILVGKATCFKWWQNGDLLRSPAKTTTNKTQNLQAEASEIGVSDTSKAKEFRMKFPLISPQKETRRKSGLKGDVLTSQRVEIWVCCLLFFEGLKLVSIRFPSIPSDWSPDVKDPGENSENCQPHQASNIST